MINNIEEFETALRRLNAICDVPFRIRSLEDELLEYVRKLEQSNRKYNTSDLVRFGYYVRGHPNNTIRENYQSWKKNNTNSKKNKGEDNT